MSARRTSEKPRHLLGLKDLSKNEIEFLLKRAETLCRGLTKGQTFLGRRKGRTLITLFFEPSTRTRISFELAACRLGMNVVSFSSANSSTQKGETLLDTIKNLNAMKPSAFVLRIPDENKIEMLASVCSVPLINAGDGAGEHPTQALLDALTIRRAKGNLKGLKVAIIGDIRHSRVARSNFHLLPKFGAKVFAFGPDELMPDALPKDVVRAASMTEALRHADVVMMLRIQLERMTKKPLSLQNYFNEFGLNRQRLALAAKDAIVLHPGPMNRGLEISDEVADDPRQSLILEQVTNGIAVRMAVLELLTK